MFGHADKNCQPVWKHAKPGRDKHVCQRLYEKSVMRNEMGTPTHETLRLRNTKIAMTKRLVLRTNMTPVMMLILSVSKHIFQIVQCKDSTFRNVEGIV